MRLFVVRTEFLESRKWNTSATTIELLLRKQVILLLLVAVALLNLNTR